jgi:hypothetical protein
MRWLLGLVLLLSVVTVAQAELFICGDTTILHRWTFADPTQAPSCPAPYTRHQIAEAQTASQLALIESLPRKYLKVEDSLAVEKSQAEKDAADAALAAKQQERQEYEDAATNNDLCNATLAQLETAKDQLATNLQGDIDGISNIATAKTELADMMGRLVNALEKLMRCIRGRAGPPQAP